MRKRSDWKICFAAGVSPLLRLARRINPCVFGGCRAGMKGDESKHTTIMLLLEFLEIKPIFSFY